jgi:aldose 1-epimerase
MQKKFFGKTEKQNVYLYTLTNSHGMSLSVTNYGCAVQSLRILDKQGERRDVVLGFDHLKDYIKQKYYIGTVIGRCANRIKGAEFEMNGREHHLSVNEGQNHLHGGFRGFHDRIWEAEYEGEDRIIFRYFSPNGEEGYPGNLEARVSYELTADNAVEIQYYATTDADTIVNLTNHSYFNLEGHNCGTILDHNIQIFADAYTEIDESSTPTGIIAPVKSTPFDLKEPARIRERIRSSYKQMQYGSGYNHNYILKNNGQRICEAAMLMAPSSGISMVICTTAPGLQFYTGNYLKVDIAGKGGVPYTQYAGLCLETQGFPDAVHNAHFPSVILRKESTFTSKTQWIFQTI